MLFSRVVVLFCACISCAAPLLISGCGKKTAPTLKSFEKPGPVSGLSAVHIENVVHLKWTYPKDKAHTVRNYVILRSEGREFLRLAETENNVHAFADEDIVPGTTYSYNVLAQNNRGTLSSDTVIVVRTEPPPPRPGAISFEVKDNFVHLKWRPVSTGAGYNVYKSSEAGSCVTQPVNKVPLTDPAFSDSFNVSRKVFYSVRALTGPPAGNLSGASPELLVDPNEFSPAAPEGVRSIVSSEKVYLSWNGPAESWVTGFRVYKKTGTGPYKLAAETQIPAFIDSDPDPGTRDYRVHAVGPLLEGPGAEVRGLSLEPVR